MDLGLGADISPTKSLSSLAGSDSESDHDGDDELYPRASGMDFTMDQKAYFNPPLTSTQNAPSASPLRDGMLGMTSSGASLGSKAAAGSGLKRKQGSSFGWMGYNSQYDVNGQVDAVSKFMEKDVDLDYDKWLRDLTPEAEDVV